MIDARIYNWEELAKDYSIETDENGFLEKFLDVDLDEFSRRLELLDGSYSIAIERDGMTILARDKIGIRPVFYEIDDGIRYAFDKRELDGEELDPRTILVYDKEVRLIPRSFFKLTPIIQDDKETIIETLRDLLLESIIKRVPKDGSPVGVMFSGGVDSTFLAYSLKMLKEQGKIRNDVICYTAGFSAEGQEPAKDLLASEKIAKEYGLKVHTNIVDLDKAETIIKNVIAVIKDTNVVKVGVGATGVAAGEMAEVKVIFTGLGSEEIFAGYERHKKSEDINKECLRGLEMVHERDCYRDFILCKEGGIELRLPFLDDAVVEYSLRIPAEYKLNGQNKKIFREVAMSVGINEDFAERKKLGAQYGSKFDRAIMMLAKRNGFKYKSDYLDSHATWNL